MDSSSKFFFSFSVNYAMIVKLVDLIVLLGSKLLNRFRKFSTRHSRHLSLCRKSLIFYEMYSFQNLLNSLLFSGISSIDVIPVMDLEALMHGSMNSRTQR